MPSLLVSRGLGGFHPELRVALSRYGSTRISVAYPRSPEGDQAAEAIASELGTRGVEVFRIVLPLGMSANQYLRSEGPDALQTVVRAATWMRGTRPVVVPAAVEPAITGDPETAPTTTAAPSAAGIDAEVRDEEVVITFGDRRWRIRGLSKNTSYDSLRLNLLVSRGDAFHVDTLELYAAKQRASFLKDAAAELGVEERVLKSDLGRIVLRLEELVHENIEKALEVPKPFEMSEAERAEAMALLKDPHLVERVLEDFKRAGVVGEEVNLLVGFLAAVSRKLDAPLAVVIQSSSAAGKSSLMEATLRFVPEEDRVQYSAMTGQSLYYLGETDLQHRILAIAEEQGAQNASYALKLLQSEGELTIASTGKEATTGRLLTHQYRVKGPVAIFLTTTKITVDEELLNRCLVLTVDERPRQTGAIHARQREATSLAGILSKEETASITRLHQNAQRLLEPLLVAIPREPEIPFSNRATRSRRDFPKFLTLIQSVALLHQHQRPILEAVHGGKRYRYIEATTEDIAVAERLAKTVIGHSLDELPPQTRRLLGMIEAFVKKRAELMGIDPVDVRFSRRELRAETGWGDTQLKVHLRRLEDLEYVLLHSGGARRRMVFGLARPVEDLTSAPFDAVHHPGEGETGRLGGVWAPPGRGAETRPDRGNEPNDSAASTDLGGPFEEALIPGDEDAARCALHAEDEP